MSWVDVVAALIIILVAFVESKRGFGRALFDIIGLVVSLKLAIVLAGVLHKSTPIGASENGSEAFWTAVLFIVFGVLTVLASKVLYETTLLSLDVLDPTLGAILGIGSGLMVAHIFLRVLILAYTGTPLEPLLAGTFAARQILYLSGYSHVLNSLYHLGEAGEYHP